MKGRGEFVGNGGKHRKFAWSCDYDAKRGRVKNVDVTVDD
jgi:hypothetical protein